MRSVAPRLHGVPEITIAEEQHEYFEVVGGVIQYANGARAIVTRWRLSDEERAKVASGADLFIELVTFGQPMQPIRPDIGPPDWSTPEGDENAGTRQR